MGSPAQEGLSRPCAAWLELAQPFPRTTEGIHGRGLVCQGRAFGLVAASDLRPTLPDPGDNAQPCQHCLVPPDGDAGLVAKGVCLDPGVSSDWEFRGTTYQQYAQVGNAVPVRLGEVAGEVIASHMDTLARRTWKPYASKPQSYRIVYVQSHVRTRMWYKAGKTFIWEDGEDNGHAAYEPPQTLRRVTTL